MPLPPSGFARAFLALAPPFLPHCKIAPQRTYSDGSSSSYRERPGVSATRRANPPSNTRTTLRILPASIARQATAARTASAASATSLRLPPSNTIPASAFPATANPYFWCTGEDSNLRSSKVRQIYSLLPLTTRPPVHPDSRASRSYCSRPLALLAPFQRSLRHSPYIRGLRGKTAPALWLCSRLSSTRSAIHPAWPGDLQTPLRDTLQHSGMKFR